jgi:predicted DNA-binding protein YlxM (UPF0122 family)
MEAFEKLYVEDVYNEIADEFNKTRHSCWPSVTKFINSLEKNNLFLMLVVAMEKICKLEKI